MEDGMEARAPDAPPGNMRFGAFLSYRHCDPDRQWARWLHRALESWRTPEVLVRRLGVPKRLGRVFRDEDELAATAHLSQDIQAALDASGWLVVVCSPRAPASRWVDAEIRRFSAAGRGERVLALLIEGQPEKAYPPALYGMRAMPMAPDEPLAADVRAHPGENQRARRRAALLRLVATMLGVSYDDLRRREQERRHRRLALLGVVLALLAAALGGLAAYAFSQQHRAEEAARLEAATLERAEDLTQFLLVDLRQRLAPLGRLDLMREVALRARAYYEDLPTRAYDAGKRAKRIAALGEVANVFRAQGDLVQALEVRDRSVGEAAALAQADPTSQRRGAYSQALLERGEILEDQGDSARARADVLAAADITRELAREEPGEVRWTRNAAVALLALARLDESAGHTGPARDGLTKALALYATLVDSPSASDQIRGEWLSTRQRIAISHGWTGDARRKLAELEALLPSFRARLEHQPEEPHRRLALAKALVLLADARHGMGKAAQAAQAQVEAQEHFDALVRHDPTNVQWASDRATGHVTLGERLLAMGDLQGAAVAYRAACDGFLRLAQQDPSNVGAPQRHVQASRALANCLAQQGDLEAAIAEAQAGRETAAALAARRPAPDGANQALAVAILTLADLHSQLGHWQEYESLHPQAGHLMGPIVDPGEAVLRTPWIGAVHLVATARRALGEERSRDALESVRRALAELLPVPGTSSVLPAQPVIDREGWRLELTRDVAAHAQPNDPEQVVLLAEAFEVEADALDALRDVGASREALAAAGELWGHLCSQSPELWAWAEERVRVVGHQAAAAHEARDGSAALELRLREVELRRDLAAAVPRSVEAESDLVDSLVTLARTQENWGTPASAQRSALEARERGLALLGRYPDLLAARASAYEAYNAVASSGADSTDPHGVASARQALGLLRRHIAERPDFAPWRRQLPRALGLLAECLRKSGDAEGSAEALAEALTIDLEEQAKDVSDR
jgi:hypothetical protein